MRNFIDAPNYEYSSNYYPRNSPHCYPSVSTQNPINPYPYSFNIYPTPNYPNSLKSKNWNESNFEEVKSFYFDEFEKNRVLILEECQRIIRTELENQSRKFLKEKDELLFSLKEQERELDYLRSLSSHQSNSREHTNSNSEKVYKNPHNSTKNEKKKKIFEKKKSSEKYFADQKYVEFENKIDNLEKHINDLKLGFNKKENNAQRVVHHNVHDEDKSRDLYNEKNITKLKDQMEKSKAKKKHLKKQVGLLAYTLNSYDKLVKDLDISATHKNRIISQKLLEIHNDIKKNQKYFEKNKD